MELRQTLVAKAIKKQHPTINTDMHIIKHKALFSNLLISRDMNILEEKLDYLRGSVDPTHHNNNNNTNNNTATNLISNKNLKLYTEYLHTTECIQSDSLLQEYEHTIVIIKTGIKTQDIDMLDIGLSQASYYGFYFPEVKEAMGLLEKISKNPCDLIKPIVESLRNNDITKLEKTFLLIEKVGWNNIAVNMNIITKIYDRVNKITQVRNGFYCDVSSVYMGFIVMVVVFIWVLL